MKNLIVAILLIPVFSIAQLTRIPDANFEQQLINLGYDNALDGGVATANISAMNIMSNKIKTYNKFKKLGISVPDFVVVNNYDELINQSKIFNKNSGSFVIKEPVARGNRGTLLVDQNINGIKDYHGSRELHMGWDHYNNNFIKNSNFNFPLIVTERMFEPAYDIDVLAKNGKVIHAIPRERINPAGVPYKGNILRNNKDLFNLAEKVTQALKLSWLYDLDIMTKKNFYI